MTSISPPEMGDKLFDNLFGRMALEMDPYTEAHPVGTMTSWIAIFSAYIGNGPRIVSTGKSMPLAFWPILCGLSGKGRKGTATNLALGVAAKAIPSFTNGGIQFGFDSGLGLIQELHSRITSETAYGPEPMLVVEEELSKLQDQARKDRRLGTTLTKLWDGATLQYTTGKDRIQVPHPHAAFVGHVQPKLFSTTRGSKDASGGTWNRFLIFWVERSKVVNIFGEMSGYDAAVERLARDFRSAATFASNVPRVKVAASVAQQFEKIHRPAVEALTNTSEEISEFAERAMAYMLRVAALYALADREEYVQIRHFDSALDLIRYSVRSLEYVLSSNRTFDGRSSLAQKVLAYITEFGPCTFTQMRRKMTMSIAAPVYMNALRELAGEVVLYTLPKVPGRRGAIGRYVALVGDSRIPENAIYLELSETDASDEADPPAAEDHPNYWAQERDTIVVEAEIIEDEPESPPETVRALPAPRPPKASARGQAAHTEAPKVTPATSHVGGGGERPASARRPKRKVVTSVAEAADPSGWV